MTFVGWIIALVGPVVARVLLSLGYTAVSFAAVSTLFNALVDYALEQWAVLPSAVLGLASLSGIPEALGMIFSAYAARLAVWSVSNGMRFVKTS